MIDRRVGVVGELSRVHQGQTFAQVDPAVDGKVQRVRRRAALPKRVVLRQQCQHQDAPGRAVEDELRRRRRPLMAVLAAQV
jgi:hypothetical protein